VKKQLYLASFLVLVLASVQSVAASVVSVGAIKDNTLYPEPSGLLSNGQGYYLFAGLTVNTEIRRALLAFDVAAAIPAGSTINSVELSLNMSRCGPNCFTPSNMSLHSVLADWGEGASVAGGQEGAGGLAAPGDATWLHTFYATDFWANPGGDFSPAASATTVVTDLGLYTWGSTASMVADVQAWLDNPASNFGWLIKDDEAFAGTGKRFDSRNNLIPSLRPTLRIDYTPIPEPATLFFVGMGMVAILKTTRRRSPPGDQNRD
jgi:hypothetical protein